MHTWSVPSLAEEAETSTVEGSPKAVQLDSRPGGPELRSPDSCPLFFHYF